jgi:hypothetical protein
MFREVVISIASSLPCLYTAITNSLFAVYSAVLSGEVLASGCGVRITLETRRDVTQYLFTSSSTLINSCLLPHRATHFLYVKQVITQSWFCRTFVWRKHCSCWTPTSVKCNGHHASYSEAIGFEFRLKERLFSLLSRDRNIECWDTALQSFSPV